VLADQLLAARCGRNPPEIFDFAAQDVEPVQYPLLTAVSWYRPFCFGAIMRRNQISRLAYSGLINRGNAYLKIYLDYYGSSDVRLERNAWLRQGHLVMIMRLKPLIAIATLDFPRAASRST
jgi:hypothetical protein